MDNRIRVTYVISNIQKALAFEWINDQIDRSIFDLSFILMGNEGTPLEKYLNEKGAEVRLIRYAGKKHFAAAIYLLVKLFLKKRPDVVHTHLFEANMAGLTAAWLLRIRKRIYTRHHAMVHYDEYRQGLKWDKWCNAIATDIIAISENIREVLVDRDKADPAKVKVIHHGFDLQYFRDVPNDRIDGIRRKYGITSEAYPVVGVIARFVKWKGIQYVIPAVRRLQKQWPKIHLILANASGGYESEIVSLLNAEPLSHTVIRFENDLAALYKTFDVYVHVPVDATSEAFGQTYVEALAAGVPSVFTLSGVAREFIRHADNAMVVNFKDSDAIAANVQSLLTDTLLRSRVTEAGKNAVRAFALEKYIADLQKLYKTCSAR